MTNSRTAVQILLRRKWRSYCRFVNMHRFRHSFFSLVIGLTRSPRIYILISTFFCCVQQGRSITASRHGVPRSSNPEEAALAPRTHFAARAVASRPFGVFSAALRSSPTHAARDPPAARTPAHYMGGFYFASYAPKN